MFGNMFKFNKTLDVLTLFHSPTSPASSRVLSVLKSANSDAEASPSKKPLFELDVVEGPMTATQLKSICDYIGGEGKVGSVVKGASGVGDAMKILEEAGGVEKVERPITVDWLNGRAVIGADESAIKKLIDQLPKS